MSDQYIIKEQNYAQARFVTYQLNAPADMFHSFAPIISLYNEKKADHKLPSWDDMDFYDFVGWHGWVGVLEQCDMSRQAIPSLKSGSLKSGGLKSRGLKYRLFGTRLEQYYGFDGTGKAIFDLPFIFPNGSDDLHQLCQIVLNIPAFGVYYDEINCTERNQEGGFTPIGSSQKQVPNRKTFRSLGPPKGLEMLR